MGLCKCPQRKVTNIFCYEHRVNVCEHCLMHNHPKCVVDTYRNWITDSLFSTKCGLCEDELTNSDTVRLLCFHIVHWDCLDSWARSLPATTAPAGYTCPICKKMGLFPPLNQVSPIADALRSKMGEVNWARAGLGLPLLDKEIHPRKETAVTNGINGTTSYQTFPDKGAFQDFDKRSNFSDGSASSNFNRNLDVQSHSNMNDSQGSPHTKFNQSYGAATHNSYYDEPASASTSSTNLVPNPRKSIKSDFETPLLIDEDDHKYRRRSPFESLTRWLKNVSVMKSRRGRRGKALYVVLSIIAIIILLMLIFGHGGGEDDEGFNPQANPNVIIGHGKGIIHGQEEE